MLKHVTYYILNIYVIEEVAAGATYSKGTHYEDRVGLTT